MSRANPPATRPFRTAEAAVKSLSQPFGPPDEQFSYAEGDGQPVGLVLLWEGDDDEEDAADDPRRVTIARRGRHWFIDEMTPPRPLYRAAELTDSPHVHLVPAEEDVERLRGVGLDLAVTCCPPPRDPIAPNAENRLTEIDWRPLAGKRVTVMPYDDDAGTAWGTALADFLNAAADLGCTADVSTEEDEEDEEDDEENETEQTGEDGADVEPGKPGGLPHVDAAIRAADEFDQTEVAWLWPGRIALGRVTLLAGDPGMGKSLLTLHIAARVTGGWSWPDAQNPPPWQGGVRGGSVESPEDLPRPLLAKEGNRTGNVIILSAEDNPQDTICPRLQAAGAMLERVHILSHLWGPARPDGRRPALRFSVGHDFAELVKIILRLKNCKLVIIDPITAFLGRTDLHRHAEIQRLLGDLAVLARETSVAVLAVTHLNKRSGGPAIHRAMGSLAFTAAARCVWVVTKDASDPHGARRLLVAAKNNLGPDQNGLSFSIICPPPCKQPLIEWHRGAIVGGADEMMRSGKNSLADRTAMSEAVDWLRELLEQGPVSSNEIKQPARHDGITQRSLWQAKGALCVASRRISRGGDGQGQWSWELPDDDKSVRGGNV